MSNNLLFFLFPAIFLVSSAFPIAEIAENETILDEEDELWFLFGSECRKEKDKFFECARKVLNTTVESANQIETQEQFGKTIACMGEISCGTWALVKYEVFSNAFQNECKKTAADCINSANITNLNDYCASRMPSMFEDKQSLKIHLTECVAVHLNDTACDENDKKMVLRAEFARMDFEEVMKPFNGAYGRPNMTFAVNFKHKFDPEAYLDVKL